MTTPITLEQYRARETANPRARPITPAPIGAYLAVVDPGDRTAREFNPSTRRSTTTEETIDR